MTTLGAATPDIVPHRPSRRLRVAGVYFSLVGGLAWLSMFLLLVLAVPRFERVFDGFGVRGGLPPVTQAAICLSHAAGRLDCSFGLMVAGSAVLLAALCAVGRWRWLLIAAIASGATSVGVLLVSVAVALASFYGTLISLAGRAAAACH
ncbi:MAG: hypothetical protein FJ288_10370 [Planctomycetes bacterium]|nr:hypothetical protein [Planctomycetota bacterium]